MASSNKNHIILKFALGAAIVILVALCVLLYRQYQHIQRLDYFDIHRQSIFKSLHGSGPLTAADASSTQSWMTFGYIDRAFDLPQSYLETSLDIADSRYPRMTIVEYAKDAGIGEVAALAKVQDAIGAYFAAKQ